MPILPRSHSSRLFSLIFAALVVLPAAEAQLPAAGQLVCGGRLRVLPPEGWQLTQAGNAGAVLRPPDPQGAPIEIVGWDVPRGGEPSALAAATAQETLLYRTSPYARTSARDYTTAANDTGLLVTGKAKGPDDKLQDALFAAFVQQGRYYIIGTFAPEGTAEAAFDGPFGAVVRSLRFEAPAALAVAVAVTPAVAPPVVKQPVAVPPVAAPPVAAPSVVKQPVTVPAPVTINPPPTSPLAPIALPAPTRAPTSPVETPVVTITPSRPSAVAPATPPAATPPVADVAASPPATAVPAPAPPPVRYVSPLGFELEHPVGWKVAVVGGHVEVTSPVGDGSDVPGALAAIWPLTGVPAGQDAAGVARQLLQNWPVSSAGAAGLVVRTRGDVVVLAGNVGAVGKLRRLVACCQVKGDTGTLTALVSRPEDFEAKLPALVAILGSFSGGPWWTIKNDVGPAVTMWRDPAAKALQATVPAGWKVRGGTQNYNGSWSVFMDLSSTDARHISVTWQQPLTPLYRELTTVLRNLGWQEGDKYVANPGDQPLRILSRLSPQDFLTRQWLPNSTLRLENPVIDRLESRPEAAGLVTGANAAAIAALLHGTSEYGPRQRFCVIATGDAPSRIGANCWQAAVLQVDAPAGALDEALAVLRDVITSADLAPEAPSQAAGAMRQLSQAARQALTVLPAAPQNQTPAKEVLSALAPKGKGDLWLLSPEALDCWQWAARRLTQGQDCAGSFPELQPAFWK